MIGLEEVKQRLSGHLEFRALKRHGSRLGRHLAPRYTTYLRRCRTEFRDPITVPPDVKKAVEEFEQKGFTSLWTSENQKLAEVVFARIEEEERRGHSIWDENERYTGEIYTKFPEIEGLFRGPLGAFLTAIYRSYFKIYFGLLYRSRRILDAPTGSQLWHTDGGPGTCINVLFYLRDVAKEDGAMECLPWEASMAIYRKELRSGAVQHKMPSQGEGERDAKCRFYLEEISRRYADRVEQPTGKTGLLVPFRNNILHKGGYPEAGRTRYACVFHCYPSHLPTQYERYREVGIPKMGAYPEDPAAEF